MYWLYTTFTGCPKALPVVLTTSKGCVQYCTGGLRFGAKAPGVRLISLDDLMLCSLIFFTIVKRGSAPKIGFFGTIPLNFIAPQCIFFGCARKTYEIIKIGAQKPTNTRRIK